MGFKRVIQYLKTNKDKQSVGIDTPLPISTHSSFFTNVALGLVPGYAMRPISSENPNMQAGVLETIWDQGGLYTYLTADTQLYASSSSTSDVGLVIVILGLDENYEEITRSVVLNGQSQVNLDGLMFRVNTAFVFGATEPQGDVYIAESDTLTGGVPNTSSKIKSKIIQGKNVTANALYTVPANKTICGIRNYYISGKGSDVSFSVVQRLLGGVFLNLGTFRVYQNIIPFFIEDLIFEEKSDLEVRGITDNTGTPGSFFAAFLLKNN